MEIILEGRTEVINLNTLNNSELEHMIQIALEFENYEMRAHLHKFLNTKFRLFFSILFLIFVINNIL